MTISWLAEKKVTSSAATASHQGSTAGLASDSHTSDAIRAS